MKAPYLIIQRGLTYYCVKSVVSLELGSQRAERFLSTFSECWYGSCSWGEVRFLPLSLRAPASLQLQSNAFQVHLSLVGGSRWFRVVDLSNGLRRMGNLPYKLNPHPVHASLLCIANSSLYSSHFWLWGAPTPSPRAFACLVVPSIYPPFSLLRMHLYFASHTNPIHSSTAHCFKGTEVQTCSYIKLNMGREIQMCILHLSCRPTRNTKWHKSWELLEPKSPWFIPFLSVTKGTSLDTLNLYFFV